MMRSAARSKGTWVAMLAALGLVLMVVLTSPGSHPKPAQAQDTNLSFARASLVVDGVEIAAFNEVEEITSSIKLSRADGNVAQLETLSIVLKRPANGDLSMSSWHRAATTQVTGYRKNAALILYDDA